MVVSMSIFNDQSSLTATARRQFLVSAPAKAILFGEHAVVHGQACIATTVDKRTFGWVSTSSPSSRHHPKMKELQNQNQEFNINKEDNNSTPPPYFISLHCPDIDLMYDSRNHLQNSKLKEDKVPAALEAFLTLCETLKVEDAQVTIRSEIPVGAGLGSSASFSVVLSTLLLLVVGELQCPALHGDDDLNPHSPSAPSNNYTPNHNFQSATSKGSSISVTYKARINEMAFLAEKVLHGNPSGVDNTLCTYGGAKIYQRGVDLLDLVGFYEPTFLVTDTTVPKNTKYQVEKYNKGMVDMPLIFGFVNQAIGGVSLECIKLFKMWSENADSQNSEGESKQNVEDSLSRLIQVNQSLLATTGMSCPALETVVRETEKLGLSSKLTGAGGGGCALTFIPTGYKDEEAIAILKEKLEERGMKSFETRLGVPGVMIHRKKESQLYLDSALFLSESFEELRAR